MKKIRVPKGEKMSFNKLFYLFVLIMIMGRDVFAMEYTGFYVESPSTTQIKSVNEQIKSLEKMIQGIEKNRERFVNRRVREGMTKEAAEIDFQDWLEKKKAQLYTLKNPDTEESYVSEIWQE